MSFEIIYEIIQSNMDAYQVKIRLKLVNLDTKDTNKSQYYYPYVLIEKALRINVLKTPL